MLPLSRRPNIAHPLYSKAFPKIMLGVRSESKFAQSTADFLTKLTIALKEANETKYWIDRLFAGGYLSDMEHDSIIKDNEEIISILVKITGTLKQRMQK